MLHQLALHLGKSATTLRIYDPYYCEGSVVLHLRALGFTNVYNRNEDFYKRIAGAALQRRSATAHPPLFRCQCSGIRRVGFESSLQLVRSRLLFPPAPLTSPLPPPAATTCRARCRSP